MPLYEFRCRACQVRFTLLARTWGASLGATCRRGGSPGVERLVSRFYHRAAPEPGEARSLPGDDYYREPRNIGRWTEKRFRQMGLELPPEVQDDIEVARQTELPESWEEG